MCEEFSSIPAADTASADRERLAAAMELQPTMNIGAIGHVAHGKSSIVRSISGIDTVKFDAEKINNITIKLGYANAKIYRCGECPRPQCYQSRGSHVRGTQKCTHCGGVLELVRHISFVDCPGHEVLMATMINGAAVMDAAMLVVAANEKCPQPQTAEHLVVAEIMRLQKMVVVQNKIDIVSMRECREHHEEVEDFIEGTVAEGAPIIPVSAQHEYNKDALLEYLANIPAPERRLSEAPRMVVIRSFDVNKPGTRPRDVVGGIAGGSIVTGVFSVGQRIELRPGLITRTGDKVTCEPLFATITSLHSEKNALREALPGGLIGMGTTLDPSLTRADRLTGQVIGAVGSLPPVFVSVTVRTSMLKRLVGAEQDEKVEKLRKGEQLQASVGSRTVTVTVTGTKDNLVRLKLASPCCAEVESRVSLSRQQSDKKHWRLVGWGIITDGDEALPAGPYAAE